MNLKKLTLAFGMVCLVGCSTTPEFQSLAENSIPCSKYAVIVLDETAPYYKDMPRQPKTAVNINNLAFYTYCINKH